MIHLKNIGSRLQTMQNIQLSTKYLSSISKRSTASFRKIPNGNSSVLSYDNVSKLDKFPKPLTFNSCFLRGFKQQHKEDLKVDESLKEVTSANVDAITQKVISSNKINADQAWLVRLGILEGYLYKKKVSSVNENFPKVMRFLVYAFIGIYIVTSGFFKNSKLKSLFESDKFKSTDETGTISDVRFEDVGGVDEAKEELTDVVHFLKDPQKFTQLGARLPKGILLVGPPGTGKTLLAKAVAGEAGVPFFYAAGSEFDEAFVGVGASRIRQLFESARAQAPAIIFIDEIDACGGQRSKNPMHPYARQTINQLLQEMDGFQETTEPVIVLGATNTGDALDKALTRPGRFDTKVQVQIPDIKGRTDLIEMYLNKVTCLKDEIDIEKLATLTMGMSGADISNLVNQAALQAAKLEKTFLGQDDLEFALDKIKMGPENKSKVRSKEDVENTAFHEAGHALIAYFNPAAHKIYKATILQRGSALGHVSFQYRDDQNMTKEQIMAQVDVAMGGRVAEELLYGEEKVSTGASSDIQMATSSAYQLVCHLGMSKKLGLMTYDLDTISEETKHLVDQEVKKFLEESYSRAKDVLNKHSSQHKLLAEALLKYETLSMDEIKLTLESMDIEAVKRKRKSLKSSLKQPIDTNPDTNPGIQLIRINV